MWVRCFQALVEKFVDGRFVIIRRCVCVCVTCAHTHTHTARHKVTMFDVNINEEKENCPQSTHFCVDEDEPAGGRNSLAQREQPLGVIGANG